jgi:hypothetical protein
MFLPNLHRKALALSLVSITVPLFAKDKHPKLAPQDEIQVVGHIADNEGPIVRFLATQHYRRNYLYAEHQSGKQLTLVDVTDVAHPTLLAQVGDGPTGGELINVTGNAALVAESNAPSQPSSAVQTFRILSFADPAHPVVQREFTGVTATARDEKRGLIFLANGDGIWILQQHFATDPEFEKEWEHMMLDNR